MSLKDIANTVGVSVSTVSRVLNQENSSAASAELKRKIWEVAKAQDYVPNASARHLRNKLHESQSRVYPLYCIYACPDLETKDDPFYYRLIESIEKEAFKYNYILKCTYPPNAVLSSDFSQFFDEKGAECAIILGRCNKLFYSNALKYFKKIIYVGLNILDIECDQIICNSYDAACDAIEFLYGLGHRKIAYVGSNEARYRGYYDTMLKLGLHPQKSIVVRNAFLSMEGGYKGMTGLLESDSDFTAAFCANDMVAIGALRACKEHGISVPEQMSLLGMNDVENVQYTEPGLASIRVPLEEMGKMAVNILLNRLNGGHVSSIKVSFPYEIIKRNSCAELTIE